MISDYSFYGVNDDTVPLSPNEAMQFCRTFNCVLYHIHQANDRCSLVYMSKINL